MTYPISYEKVRSERIKNIADEETLKHGEFYSVRYYTRDGVGGGPVDYKAIEWIFVPASPTNDIHALKNLIDELGLYEYDFDENGLKIYGYK